MTTRAATSNSAVDAPSAWSAEATTPVTPTRPEASEALPGVFAEMPPDAVALTRDLTVNRLHQAFARCIAPPVTEVLDAGASQELARIRLPATRHAVDDIRAALCRMAAGTYGVCQRCGCMIAADRMQAAPTARWCAACPGVAA
jgi:RNA polymerase-binding transcription factor DksA